MSHHEPEPNQQTSEGDQIKIKPRGFHIVWGNDNRYWQLPNGSSDEPAELKQVCWLEITGSVEVDPGKKYGIEFKVSMKDGAFGWNGCPVFMMAKLGKRGRYIWKKINLSRESKTTEQFSIPGPGQELVITVPENSLERKLFFGLYEVWSGKWKGGLKIHKAIITKQPTT